MTAVTIILYNRPKHTLRLFQSIIKAKNYHKFFFNIFCDGPKNSYDQEKIKEIKKILNQFKNKINYNLHFRKKNLGLKNNVVKSINTVFKIYDRTIVLEDDLIIDINFFIFMEKALIKFGNSNEVLQISGYSYPIKTQRFHYFLPLTSCWGWGITKEKWKKFVKFFKNFEILERQYLEIKKSKNLKSSFNFNNSYNYFSMLENSFKNNISSWGIIFYLYLFTNNMVTLFPNISHIKNKGFDGSGNHKSKTNIFNDKFYTNKNIKFPLKVEIFNLNIKKVEIFFRENLTLFAKIKKRIHEKFI